MSASKQNFFAAHWDWLVAVVGLAAFAGAGVLLALSLGNTPEAGAAEYEAELKGIRPAHEGVAPANMDVLQKAFRDAKTPPTLQGVESKKGNFLASERRVVCQQGDPDSKAKACGRPIPADCELCPYCKAKQSVVRVEVDTDHDGLPNDWEKKFGLNPNDPSDAKKDNDGDGFTNLEEYEAKTDPNDKESHPDYLDSLTIAGELRQTTLPFFFSNARKIPDGYRFIFQRPGVKIDATVTAKMNAEIMSADGKSWKSGWEVSSYEQKQEMREIAGAKGLKRPVDVSTVVVTRKADGKKLTIRMNEKNVPIESQTELSYNRGQGRKIVVSPGTEFELNGQKYRVEKLRSVNNGCEVTILDLKTKKEKILR